MVARPAGTTGKQPSDTGEATGIPYRTRVIHMAQYDEGTLLTCGHEGCGCRVRIEVECHCSGSAEAYRCTCGDQLVPVK